MEAEATSFTEEEIARMALYNVIDPELFVNIVDLGLIYEIGFPDRNHVDVLMTLSTPHCPMGEAITNGVRNALEDVFPGREIGVTVTFDPLWSFEMLTEEGRSQLGI